MATRKIRCAFWGPDHKVCDLTLRQITLERDRLRGEAYKLMREHPEYQHVLYYRDRRNDDDKIFQAHFYTQPVPCTDDELFEYTSNEEFGLIGAVHNFSGRRK